MSGYECLNVSVNMTIDKYTIVHETKRGDLMYKYPRVANWLEFKQLNNGRYEVRDGIKNDTNIISGELGKYLQCLDGSIDPADILQEWDQLDLNRFLNRLYYKGLLRKRGRRLNVLGDSRMFTVYIPHATEYRRYIAAVYNALLMTLFIPVFGIGILLHIIMPENDGYFLDTWAMIAEIYGGIFVGYLLGVFFHEMSHGMACLAYGGSVFEYGLTVRGIFPGGYTLMNTDHVKGRFCKTQILAAGLEMNLMIAGVSLISMQLLPVLYLFFQSIALLNIELVLLNSLCVSGFDGNSILGTLLGGDEAIVINAEEIVKSRYRRYTIMEKQGINGIATVVMYYILFAMQIMQPLLLLINIIIWMVMII